MFYHGFGDTTSDDKVAMTNNIITLVRAHQASNLPVDYASLMAAAKAVAGGPNDPEIAEIATLLNALQATNPYTETAAQETVAEKAAGLA